MTSNEQIPALFTGCDLWSRAVVDTVMPISPPSTPRLPIKVRMPELPEVETTRRGIEPAVRGRVISSILVREPRLRWRVPRELPQEAAGQRLRDLRRRAKYLLFDLESGTMILHLGMSGSLRLMPSSTAPSLHDHVDIVLDSGLCVRFNDPRRFGSL